MEHPTRTHRKEHARRVPKDPAFLHPDPPQFLEAQEIATDLPKLFPEVRNRAEAHLIQMLQIRRSFGARLEVSTSATKTAVRDVFTRAEPFFSAHSSVLPSRPVPSEESGEHRTSAS